MTAADLELYKALKAESTGCFEKIQAVWLQKFTLVGAVIAFMAVNKLVELETLAFGPVALVGVALVPILAVILDIKVAEYSLQARAISRFIVREFPDAAKLAAWEQTMWSDPDAQDAAITRTRSLLTVVAAAIPTLLLIVASAVIFWPAYGFAAVWVGGLAATAYVASVLGSAWLIFGVGSAGAKA